MTLLLTTLFAFFALSAPDAAMGEPSDTVQNRVELRDTLRELEVRGRERLAVMDAIDASLKNDTKQPKARTLNDILSEKAGRAHDIITHPFGFKERREATRRKRAAEVQDQYQRAKTFEELLDEAVRQQQIEDAQQQQ
ncbi:MAG: hypothetical protein HUK03_10090 [Bacteroidaceae bacterium]|nr:hypothetical protein [Bacteroidaceae bacterium]